LERPCSRRSAPIDQISPACIAEGKRIRGIVQKPGLDSDLFEPQLIRPTDRESDFGARQRAPRDQFEIDLFDARKRRRMEKQAVRGEDKGRPAAAREQANDIRQLIERMNMDEIERRKNFADTKGKNSLCPPTKPVRTIIARPRRSIRFKRVGDPNKRFRVRTVTRSLGACRSTRVRTYSSSPP